MEPPVYTRHVNRGTQRNREKRRANLEHWGTIKKGNETMARLVPAADINNFHYYYPAKDSDK